jgi:hypothetical protein
MGLARRGDGDTLTQLIVLRVGMGHHEIESIGAAPEENNHQGLSFFDS